MMNEIQAPNPLPPGIQEFRVFLGGSIEMGKAEHWQKRIVNDLKNEDIVFFNPRRDDWDSSWIQDPTPGTQFHEQVTWEMNFQDASDLIVYYFDPATIAPITLLELGTYHNKKPVIVCCNPAYARYGNVKILCDRYNLPFVETYDELVDYIKNLTSNNNFGDRILKVLMQKNDAEAENIGEYLVTLAATCWEQEDGFSGKKPFGNSGWPYDLYYALAREGIIKAELEIYDDWVEVVDFDKEAAIECINSAVQALYKMVSNENCDPK